MSWQNLCLLNIRIFSIYSVCDIHSSSSVGQLMYKVISLIGLVAVQSAPYVLGFVPDKQKDMTYII